MPLASVQRVLSLNPIPGADAIECARVLGWDVVVKKGEFKVGDLGVYIEIDSIVPEIPEFSFMERVHYRVKTIRLRGQLSQGLFMPMAVLNGLIPQASGDVEGMDVTEALGVRKYEKPIPAQLAGQVKGTRPGFIPKTDEERIQSCGRVLDELAGVPVYITEKCDGSSMTVYYRMSDLLPGGEFGVCSRNMDLKEDPNNAFWKIALELGLREKMEALGRSIAIQGELCGPGIQKNPMGLEKLTLYGFNAIDLADGGRYLDYLEMNDLFNKLGISPVPLVFYGDSLSDFLGGDMTVEGLVSAADGKYANGSPREGIVVRPSKEMYSSTLKGRLSVKAVSNIYLEKVEK